MQIGTAVSASPLMIGGCNVCGQRVAMIQSANGSVWRGCRWQVTVQ
ncbi:hypothetical protein XaFJ1_GM002991 [Xanthomonas albilineans]|nr:hypothetical protein XaFJ1_GM002991 [Xanthomonas albilineans]